MGVSPFAFRYKGNGATPYKYIDTTRNALLIALQLCHWQFLYSETLQRIFVLYCRNWPKDDNIGIWSHFEERRRTLVDGSLDSPCPLFTARNARIASAVLATAIRSVCPSVCLSVCPSVRPSHAGIVSKRRHVARCSLHRWIAKCV